MRLEEALAETPTGALRQMASAHGLVHDDGTTRTELIERLVERLSDAAYLDTQLASLSAAEQAVLALAKMHAAGGLRSLLVERDYPGTAEALVERGLLFRIFAAAGPLRGELFAAPDQILERLPEPPARGAPPLDAEAPAGAERRASDPTFSLFCIASTLGRRGASLEDDVKDWSEEPGGWGWSARWTFLQHLAEAAGLIVHQADGALTAGPALARLLDDPPALFDRLWRAYLRDRTWSELGQIDIAEAADLASSVQLRAALVDALTELPDGRWIDIDSLGAWLRASRPNVVREQLSPRGLLLLEEMGWAELEQPLLRYLLLGPLYWLSAFGCTVDGSRVVRRAAMQGHPPEPCTWTGTAELLVPPRAALGSVLEAERYLLLRERGRPSRYHLVQTHVAAALGGGGSLADCRRVLVKLTQGQLPLTVEERLAAWEQRFGALTVRPAVLLEARSAGELDAALADERVQAFFRARLSPLIAEVAAADALELAAALRETDHLPRVDAALRLSADPRRAYAGLVDEQVLQFLLVSLLAFQSARPEQLTELEGSATLLERLERQFPPEKLTDLRAAAARLAGTLGSSSGPAPRVRQKNKARRRTL